MENDFGVTHSPVSGTFVPDQMHQSPWSSVLNQSILCGRKLFAVDSPGLGGAGLDKVGGQTET